MTKSLWVIGFMVLTLTDCSRSSRDTTRVARGDVIQKVILAGYVVPRRKTVLSAPYAGYVRKLFVHLGQTVHAGDPVVSVAQTLRGASDDVFPLRAPFSGTVVQILKPEGEYVDSSGSGGTNALVRIDDLSALFVESSAPEIEVKKLKVSQGVEVRASALPAQIFRGRIKELSLASRSQREWDNRGRVEYPLLIELDPTDKLLPGMSVVAEIEVKKVSQALTLPHEYVQREASEGVSASGKSYVLTPQGQKKPVDLGLQDEERYEIKSGVTEGEVVKKAELELHD